VAAVFDFGSGVVMTKATCFHGLSVFETGGELGTVGGSVLGVVEVADVAGVTGTGVLVVSGGDFLTDRTDGVFTVACPVSSGGQSESFAFLAVRDGVEFVSHCSGLGRDWFSMYSISRSMDASSAIRRSGGISSIEVGNGRGR